MWPSLHFSQKYFFSAWSVCLDSICLFKLPNFLTLWSQWGQHLSVLSSMNVWLWIVCFFNNFVDENSVQQSSQVTGSSITGSFDVQVNLCQKLLFLHQLTHNMTTDCSLNYKFNTWKFQAQNMGHTGYIEVVMQGKCRRNTETTFDIKWVIGTYGNWKNQNPGGRFGATS